MTDAQSATIAAANEKTRAGRELYDNRTRLFYLVGRLELRDLKRLTGVINTLLAASPDGALLKRVAAYAEGLAEWVDGPVESPDARNSEG